jgi:hypothetical protein
LKMSPPSTKGRRCKGKKGIYRNATNYSLSVKCSACVAIT